MKIQFAGFYGDLMGCVGKTFLEVQCCRANSLLQDKIPERFLYVVQTLPTCCFVENCLNYKCRVLTIFCCTQYLGYSLRSKSHGASLVELSLEYWTFCKETQGDHYGLCSGQKRYHNTAPNKRAKNYLKRLFTSVLV